jgi:hypothetical protein
MDEVRAIAAGFPIVIVAFVLVPQLNPGQESLLTKILQCTTAMPVVQASDQMPVAHFEHLEEQ